MNQTSEQSTLTSITANQQTTEPQIYNEVIPTVKPKSVVFISQLFFVLVISSLYSAFVSSVLILVLNYKSSSIRGMLDFEFIKAMPYIGLFSIPGILTFSLMLFAYLRVKTGSLSGWKTAILITSFVLIFQIIFGILIAMYLIIIPK